MRALKFIMGHGILKLRYNQIYQLKTTKGKLADDLDLNGFDPNAPDSDDEPLSDLEMWEGLQNIATLDFFSKTKEG